MSGDASSAYNSVSRCIARVQAIYNRLLSYRSSSLYTIVLHLAAFLLPTKHKERAFLHISRKSSQNNKGVTVAAVLHHGCGKSELSVQQIEKDYFQDERPIFS